MLFSLLYLIFRLLVRVMPGEDRDREIELLVLRHQVKVLKRKAGRPRLRRIDKAFLAACSRVLPKHRWGSFVVAPSTLLRWHRELVGRKWTYKAKSSGRPPVDSKLVALICRMAKDNSSWGYMRIKGECLKLGVRVSATTVKKVLANAGLDPAPRRDGPSWSEFLRLQADGIVACDFFSLETAFLHTLYVLFFIEVGSRRLHITMSTGNPDGGFVTQQVRNLSMDGEFEGVAFQIDETPDVEALVLVEDEHRKQLSDVRPEQNAAPRVTHGSVRREVGDPFGADRSSGIDPRILFGPPLLAK